MATIPEHAGAPAVLIHEQVTGGGSGVEVIPSTWITEGSAMRRALARDFAAAGARVAMTLDSRLPDDHGPWTTERVEPGTASESLSALARLADYTIAIAPETGGTLRDLASSIARAGGISLGSTPDAIDLAADKHRLTAHLIRAEIPTPASLRVEPRRGLPRHVAYPAVLKPIDGAGCLDTLYVASRDDPILSAFPGKVGLLQPFVVGEPRSASFIAHPGRPPILLGVGLQSISIVDGRFAYRGGTIFPADLPGDHPARRAVASVPGLSGLVGVDYIHDRASRGAVVIEINPRPTTSCVGLITILGAGRLAKLWLDSAVGSEPPSLSSSRRSRRRITFRSDGSILDPDQTQARECFVRWA